MVHNNHNHKTEHFGEIYENYYLKQKFANKQNTVNIQGEVHEKLPPIEDYAKDGGEELLPRCIAFRIQIFNDSIEIRLKNAVHPGKKFLTASFNVIVY